MTKSLSSKYGKNSLNTEIMSAPDPLRTALGGTLQKTAETTSDLVQKKKKLRRILKVLHHRRFQVNLKNMTKKTITKYL